METENVSDRSNNIFVSIGLRNVMDRYGTDQKAIPIRLSLFVNIRKSVHNFMNIISHIKADNFACQFNIKTTFIFEHKGFFSCSLIQ